MRVTCPDCKGFGTERTGRSIQVTQHTYRDETVTCTGCNGRRWVDDGTTPAPILPPPPPEERTYNDRLHKPRRANGWWLAIGLLGVLGLIGNQLNRQQTPDTDDDFAPIEPAPMPDPMADPAQTPPDTEAADSDPTRPIEGGNADTLNSSAALMQAVYVVTHKHRLRDCHGRLTFTRDGLRFESDEPEDSFNVGLDDVTIEGDVLRIRTKRLRFQFDDGIRVERVFNDWKAGILRPVSAP